MKPREFLDKIDDEKVIAAVHQAESRSDATFRVHVSHQSVPDAMHAAQRQFKRFKVHGKHRNGRVLIFVAPESHTFALLGDPLAHAACRPDDWTLWTEKLSKHFKAGELTVGLVELIEAIAIRLQEARSDNHSKC